MLILEMKKPGLEQGETGPGLSARGQWSQGPGQTPSSGLNSFFSQEGTAHLAPSLGQGWGWVSGLGCVGSRAQRPSVCPGLSSLALPCSRVPGGAAGHRVCTLTRPRPQDSGYTHGRHVLCHSHLTRKADSKQGGKRCFELQDAISLPP